MRYTEDSMTVQPIDNATGYDLTVVTVCRNAKSVLPRCIASVQPLYRGALKVEHLLVDGASTDGTREYLQEQLENGRITRLVSEPDKGLYDAMNKAITLAAGKVIVFINADDEIVPSGVEACCKPILEGVADYVVSTAAAVRADGKVKSLQKPGMDMALLMSVCCHQSYYCSTAVLRREGGFHWDKFRILADAELMGRLSQKGYLWKAVPEVSSRFYEGGVSGSARVAEENLLLLEHFREEICARAAQDAAYGIRALLQVRKYLARHARFRSDAMVTPEALALVNPLVCSLLPLLPPEKLAKLRAKCRNKAAWYGALGLLPGRAKARAKARSFRSLLSLIPSPR